MCLLDARCRCENGQCSHTSAAGALPFNSLLNPNQFLLQNQLETSFPILSLPQKLLSNVGGESDQLKNNVVKKLKRENESTGSSDNTENREVSKSYQISQNSFLPMITQLQQLNYLNSNNNNNSNSNNNNTQNTAIPPVFPFKSAQIPFLNNSFGAQTQQQQQQQQQVQQQAHQSQNNNIEATLKDMQARVMGMFAFQSRMLTDLQEKSTLQASTISMLYEEVKCLRTLVTSKSSTEVHTESPKFVQPNIYNQIAQTDDNCSINDPISPQKLIQFLFKKRENDYKYKLILNQPLDHPLYRERNFSISVSLVNRNDDVIIANQNRIPLNISIYTSENPPKFIDTNTSGNKILKGYTEKDLQHGQLVFDKIQIKEVTSHFRNGWVFLVIFPKALSYESGKITHHKDDIDVNDIRPLIIEKVVVKAKKLKESKKNSKDHFSYSNDEDSKEQDQKIEHF